MTQDVNQVLQRAKDEGEVYLCTLTRDELKKTGFDMSTFGYFEYVDIYLLYDIDYVIKYVFDGDITDTYYENTNDVGGEEIFVDIIKSYLRIGGNE